uniref:Tr-type G domain-containing protein n=1 Tax=Branchiostoma floridae TaxID=7739 RepID=C3XRD8_BRAFL|eukprot:XP_002613247.1 hypothetical protein BRAFLDRAFT_118698 [Branchiostoma floridae]
MGHVDHGKTTLLDSLRKSHIAAGEAGGITQHIGAFSVELPTGERITFLDTPGHAAFSALRARGALVTDIVVLEVVMRELLSHGMELEEFGGDIQSVKISALKVRAMFGETGQQVREAPPSTPVEVMGWKDLPSAGDLILEVETESRAHEVVGWRLEQKKEQKLAEDQVEIDRKAKEHLEHYQAVREATKDLRRWQQKKAKYEEFKPTPGSEKAKSTEPELNIVIRGDVFGSIEAIMDTLASYDCEEDCKLKVIHSDVGAITESDVEMAAAFDGVVYGFNTKVPKDVAKLAEQKNVPIKMHKIIYRLFEDLKDELSAKLPTKEELDIKGSANVLQVFEVTVGKKKVPVAGCRVTQGEMDKRRDALLVRNGEVIFRGSVSSLKHLKDDVWTVRQEMECGIALHKCPDIRHGDVIQSFEVNEVPQTIDWNPGF